MVDWNMTIGELVKKLNEDGIDLTLTVRVVQAQG
jgi:hypothetical protein